MKSNKLKILMGLLVTILLTSCKEGNATNDLLQRMEEIKVKGDTLPTEALAKLKQIEHNIKNAASDYVQNKFFLLRTRLQDKADIIPVSFDTIEAVVDYFDRHGNIEERMEAYYYKASVYRDLKDYPREMTAFHKVLDLAHENGVGDCRLLQNTYSQLSGLYNSQQLYKDALEMAKAGCDMAERTNTLDPIYLMDVATCAWHVRDSAIHTEYCLKTLDCLKRNTNGLYPSVVCELLIRFSVLKMNSEVDECFALLQFSKQYKNAHNFLPAMATYYELHGQMDSAMNYYKQCFSSATQNSMRMDAAHNLMDYYTAIKQYESAAEYARQYATFVREVFKEKQYESTSRASGEHLYATSLKKELQAREEADAYKNRVYGMAVSFLLVLFVIGIIYHQKREHYLKELLRKDEALGAAKDVLEQKEDNLHAKEKQIREIVRISLLEKASIDSASILQKFQNASYGKGQITNYDWQDLYMAVESMYPGFRESVASAPRCSELYKKTAYLIKIGLDNSQIACLTGSARNTVWERVKKAKKHLGPFLSEKMQ